MRMIYVFTEEESAQWVVEALAARYVPDTNVRVLRHRGKDELEKSFPRKLKAIVHPADARFIVLRDNDGGDCAMLKDRLLKQVPPGKAARVKIRIVMQELESWYLGQPTALMACGLISAESASRMSRMTRFRDPDRLINAKQEFLRLHGRANQQITMAQMIGPHLAEDDNASRSFRTFLSTLREFSV
jgi:Domain of unknown function (DUF4276)